MGYMCPKCAVLLMVVFVDLDFAALFPEVTDRLCMLWTATYASEVLKKASLQGKWRQSYLHITASDLVKQITLWVFVCLVPTFMPNPQALILKWSNIYFCDGLGVGEGGGTGLWEDILCEGKIFNGKILIIGVTSQLI